MKEYNMTLLSYVTNFVATWDENFYNGFDTREDEAADLIESQSDEMKAKFKKFVHQFCNDKGYNFISCDGEVLIFTK